MKPRFLASNNQKVDQQPDTYPFGKNGVWDADQTNEKNEKGFRLSSATWPYKYIGTIETDTYPVIFTTDNVNSAAGYWDVDKDIYVPIFDDSTLSYKFGFNLDHPIKGEARRNYRNEVELTWLELGDGTRNPPRWLNTIRLGTSLNDYLLFPQSKIPFITLSMQAGGNLGMGAYFIGAKYIKKDGTETRYTTLTAPSIAVSDNWSTAPGANTGKALNITLTGVDLSYDRIQLAVVERVKGVDSAYELPELNVSDTVTFIYTGSEKQAQITLDEVLIPSAYYENAKAITQLSDRLYLGNMVEEETIDWQKYASLVTIRWKSTELQYRNVDVASRKTSGYMHEESYAFFIVLKLKNGRNSRGFICVGPKPQAADLLPSSLATAQSLTGSVYQIEDTIRNLNTGDSTGDCGVWINQDELYPNTDEFDSTSVGGENLRNQPVRHFKMPSIGYCKRNLYAADGDYGIYKLDILGLEVSNVIIPPNLANTVLGWELHYARRDFNNATVIGQSLLLYGSQGKEDSAGNTNITSTGGNWGSYTNNDGDINSGWTLQVKNNHIRFHSFDMLNLRPSVSPSHLSLQLDLVMRFGGDTRARNDDSQVQYNLDYTATSITDDSKPVADSIRIRKVIDGQYVVDGEVNGDYMNTRLEDAYVAKLPTPGTLMNSGQWTYAKRDYDGGSRNGDPIFEQTWLANLMTIRRNIYVNFYSQTLVRTGTVFAAAKQASDQIIYGGDCFASYYSFITYGLVTKLDTVDNTGKNKWKTGNTDGIKVNRIFVCETISNLEGRYEDPTNVYSRFYPKSGISILLDEAGRSNNPNQFGYIKDTNAVGDLLNGIRIASPLDDFVTLSPYKIIRSEKQLAEGKVNSWKNFNALDYYETVKNKGEISNLQGYADKLIIHHTDGMFITRDKTTLTGDVLNVTLGSGDIFQLEPLEERPTKLGYAGAQNPLACILTPAGYIFPDLRTGELFIFNGEIRNLGMGLMNFLLKYLTLKDINTYVGNGTTIGYDQYYKRILLTVKNTKLQSGNYIFVTGYEATPEFYATLTPNQSVVYKDGRYQLFKGLNSSEYNCPSGQTPVLPDYNWTTDEHQPNGTVLGTIVATGGTAPYNYIILTPDKAGLAVNSLTGIVTIQNTDAFDYTRSILHLDIEAIDINGAVATGHINVTINQVESTPKLPAYARTIPEHTANGTLVLTATATDRDGKTITYSITSGNDLGGFAIDPATGAITVADSAVLEFDTHPSFTLIVRASAGTKFAENSVIISLSYVFSPPVGSDSEYSTDSTVPDNTLFGPITAATQDPLDTGELVYTIQSNSAPAGSLTLIVDPADPDYLKVKILNHLLIADGASYVIVVRVYSTTSPSQYDDFNVTVNTTAVIPCGTGSSYTGGEAYPTEQLITLGSSLGTVTLTFDAFSIPDKYIVEFDGVEVINTGYRGDSGQQSALDAALAAMGLPSETIAGPGSGTASFTKSTATTTAKVKVYAPMSGTSWNFTLGCPTP